MGKISEAMKIIPRSMKNLENITHEVADAAAAAEKALARTEKTAGSALTTTAETAAGKATDAGTAVGGVRRATFGSSTSTDYRRTFFTAHPETEGTVVVHHAVEQQVLTRYPGTVSESEMHSLENLRGIPKGEVNHRVHLSILRKEWNRFYKTTPNATQQQLLDFATRMDDKYGHLFNPPIR